MSFDVKFAREIQMGSNLRCMCVSLFLTVYISQSSVATSVNCKVW